MKKYYLSDVQVKEYTTELIRQMTIESFKPDIVVGLTRGGLVPAYLISLYFKCPMVAINKDMDVPDK